MIEHIGNVKLNLESYLGEDIYSDGSIEDEILEIVQKVPPNKYNEVIYEKAKWPIMYHLSYLRSNIINWLPISKDETILEIGSGCGAITGTLANMAKSVTCIELSKKRSMINANRNKDKDNIIINVGNFQDVEKKITEKYDYIMLIGVFEYANSYISNEKPYHTFLKIISKHLKEKGKLIIAIENKLGLKYWAGCKEDHVGKIYEGIEGYTNTKGVCTFSKKELEELFREVGFSNYKFYYPYPDYKFASTIYSDEFLPQIGELSNNMRNFDNDRVITFDEKKVFNTIISNDLYTVYSNSFLVVVEKGDI